MDEVAAIVRKGGETCVQILLSRRSRKAGDPSDWKGGMTVTVKTLPRVEEFIQSLGNGTTVNVGTIGRYWTGMSNQALEAYNVQPMAPMQSEDGASISMDGLGKPLMLPDLEGRDRFSTINLSFLRLRGISEGAGVTFGIKGVYSSEEMKKLSDKLAVASRRFYQEYLRPIDLLVTINTQIMPL